MGDGSNSAFETGVGIEVEMIRQLTFKGAIEGIAMRKVIVTEFNYLYIIISTCTVYMHVFTAEFNKSVSLGTFSPLTVLSHLDFMIIS